MTLDIEEAAREAAGNWKRFESFAWHGRREHSDPDRWGIFYTHNRDSGLLDQSNAAQIEEALTPFTEGDDPDVVFESHSHWACGHVDGFSLRVFGAGGEVTEAFRVWFELSERMSDYPILGESDYSEREYNATLENIRDAGGWFARKHDYTLPDGWEGEVFSWFWDHCQHAVENRDDQGGYPSDDELRAAFDALGYVRESDDDGPGE